MSHSTEWIFHLDLQSGPKVNDFHGFVLDFEMLRICGRQGFRRDCRLHWITAYAYAIAEKYLHFIKDADLSRLATHIHLHCLYALYDARAATDLTDQ